MTVRQSERPAKSARSHAWHALPIEAAFKAVDTTISGLSESEAARRLASDGPNRMPEVRRRGPLLRFLLQFHNLLIYVLIVSAGITLLLNHLVDTLVILAVIIGNAAIGFMQEGRAERAMEAVRDMLAPQAAVLRDGRRRRIDSARVVRGDVVLVEAGDRVPADLRLVEARGLKAEEAILTGESVPVDKSVEPVEPDVPLGERSSMMFSGTFAAVGSGRGVVVATGPSTEIGRISGLLATVETLTTPLVRQMDQFARWLTLFILVVAVSLLGYGVFFGHLPFDELFMLVVGLSVAAIPEGLPAVLTITLAVGVQAMARRNAIVRRLPAIETLGAVSVICSDKTGTLTRNEMVASSIVSAYGSETITGEGYAPVGQVLDGQGRVVSPYEPIRMELAQISALCNDASLHESADGWTVDGDPMEAALLALSGKLTLQGLATFKDWRRTDVIPFDAAHRYMAVRVTGPVGEALVCVKGAPEVVLGLCCDQRTADGGVAPLEHHRWHLEIERIAAGGQRVLALASRVAKPDDVGLIPAHIQGSLTLVGLVGLIDPPRAEAVSAVAECREAGIGVKMITGDHATTAGAIARLIGLPLCDRVLTGRQLDAMNDAELAVAVQSSDVFARTSPAHKLRLVSALQSRGLIVAMTGDGVNDAPALKRADAGIAMGRKGSEAAKQASDLVLADDNFASIVAAVREGRTVYDNIRKVISWTLPTNAGEAMTIIVALLAGLALPITAVQILWVNLVTAITLGLALAFEPGESGTMRSPPRPRDQALLSGQLVWHIGLVSALFIAAVFGVFEYALDRGYPDKLARTMAVNTLVVLEIFHLFFIRNIHGTSLTWAAVRGTPAVWVAVLTIVVAQFAITYLPPMQRAFDTEAVPLVDGVLIVGVGVAFFALLEVEKQLRLAFRHAGARTARP